ncbi:hypothetical protein V6Z11_A11G055500 [Gossypium hirsutum]
MRKIPYILGKCLTVSISVRHFPVLLLHPGIFLFLHKAFFSGLGLRFTFLLLFVKILLLFQPTKNLKRQHRKKRRKSLRTKTGELRCVLL